MFWGLIQFQIKAPDCLNKLCDLFCLQICLRRRLRPQRWSWASLRCSTPKSWSPRRSRTLWRSSPTFPGTTASSAGCLVVCSSPSEAFVYIYCTCGKTVLLSDWKAVFLLEMITGEHRQVLGLHLSLYTKHFCSSTQGFAHTPPLFQPLTALYLLYFLSWLCSRSRQFRIVTCHRC